MNNIFYIISFILLSFILILDFSYPNHIQILNKQKNHLLNFDTKLFDKYSIIQQDSTEKKEKFYFFFKLPFDTTKHYIDSLFKKYNFELDNFFENDLFNNYRKYFYKFRDNIPHFDYEKFKKFYNELETDIDSLKQKFKIFRKKNLTNQFEIIEI